jgi:uncharacterized membrane protein
MTRLFARPLPLGLFLGFASFIPVVMAGVRVVQIPQGLVPDDSLRLMAAPVAYWLHALGGAVFGLLGPVQFVRALRARFGAVHRVAGRVFGVAGLVMALSGLAVLAQIEGSSTVLIDLARAVFGLALIGALGLGVRFAVLGNRAAHRDWMIRAYVIGMGGATVGLVMLPIHLLTGEPVTGLVSDLVFIGWWCVTIGLGEGVIALARRPHLVTEVSA